MRYVPTVALYGGTANHCTASVQSAKENNGKGAIAWFVYVYGLINEDVRRGEDPGGVSGQMRLIQAGSVRQKIKIW